MYSFIISVIALIAGYFIYGRFIERIFGPDTKKVTPAVAKADGVDYVVLPTWKVFMIQFLNIAGTGPIFGAIMGAKFGPAAYLWIVLGCIFAGAVHDYLSGMLSLRHGGCGLPDIIGLYLGNFSKKVMLIFSVFLLIMVGAVFVYSPAIILKDIAGNGSNTAFMIWMGAIFIYYILATLLPVNKIIGKVYPLFAAALIFMAVSLFACLLVKWPSLPEIHFGMKNLTTGTPGSQPIFPFLFISIACGAISGFHATQSPMMAKCMENEKLGRPIFYGSMITEGLVALVWATISSYFFHGGGAEALGALRTASAPEVVNIISRNWLGVTGSILALLGVVVAPITSGDTALRSARLIIAEFVGLEQKNNLRRLVICIPLFLVTALILAYNVADEQGFNIIWRYFGWANQTLSVFTLWALTVYLAKTKKGLSYLVTLVPACFMTAVCTTFIMVSKIGLGLPILWHDIIGVCVSGFALTLFYLWKKEKCTRP